MLLVATAVLALRCGAALAQTPAPAPAAGARREALARAAAFEFDAGRPDRAAQLAGEALAIEGVPATA
ncbi:MAG: ammonia channel protein, partial [Candidatus Eisenbacteria bacterium]